MIVELLGDVPFERRGLRDQRAQDAQQAQGHDRMRDRGAATATRGGYFESMISSAALVQPR